MIHLLSAESLNVEQLRQLASPRTFAEGRQDYEQGHVSVGSVDSQSAWLSVRDQRDSQTFQVRIWANDNQTSLTCTCNQGYYWSPCRHRVAAFLALREYLKQHPPQLWKAVIEHARQAPARRSAATHGPIVFSLQERTMFWAVVPYHLSAKLFSADELHDQEAIAQRIATDRLSMQARPIRSRIGPTSYPYATPEAIAAANLSVGNPYVYGYYGREGAAFYESVFSYLPRCLVYFGDESDPLAQRLHVAGDAALEAVLSEANGGIRIQLRLMAGEQALSLRQRNTFVIVQDPLWLLVDDVLAHVPDADGFSRTLLDYPDLVVPARDQNEFLDTYLLPITERITVQGDLVQWEEVDAAPQPCLYLSEPDGEFQAELRFNYGGYDVAYDKRPPPNSVQRRPGSAQLVRIARQPEREQEAWQALSSFGLKRGPEAGVFLLRRGTDTVDFLLRQVPRLVEAGYTIYGEEALTSTKVNRNRPSISFNVKSGIDWFDVDAKVNYGELEVSLKDVRQAIRKRSRYIKLADGSIGMLPEEWIEKYRHLFGMGQEHDDSLRFANSQVLLLDQLIEESDRAQTDAEFERRREKLRSFEQIEPQKLPCGFRGELRPYQKFGYDWLHFLHEYNFGGCLADDMGVGKCVAPETQIVVNGELQTAESLWRNYAGTTQFDGEGFWAKPLASLRINAIDQRTGNMVQADVSRLYRQHVRETLRRVTLEDGSVVTMTRRHQLLTSKGWTNEYTLGDYACVPATLLWDGTPVDPDLAVLLAWQIAEGYELSQRGTVRIYQKDMQQLQTLREICSRVGSQHQLKMNNLAIVQQHDKTPALVVNSRAYQHYLKARGYKWGKRSREKEIPSFMMQADLDSIRLFLRHYFEAEASVPSSMRCVEISTASPMIIQQLATLLRRFGIWLRISVKQKCATNGSRVMRTYYNGSIGGNAARRFAQEIGFVSTRKQQQLEQVCAHLSNTNVEGIPALELVASAVATAKLPVRHFGMHNTIYLDGSQQFSRESLTRVVMSIDRILRGETEREYRQQKGSKWTSRTLAAHESLDVSFLNATHAKLQQLLNQEVFYCRIKAVEDVPYEGWVYDFEVAEYHNFVADNIICHNTIQTLAFLQSLYEREPTLPATLLVMPRSLLFNWQREAERFTPMLKVYIQADQGRISEPEAFGEHNLILTTYGTMRRDIDLLRRYTFHYAILDESQAIKNPFAETSRAARMLHAEHRLVLTGTPVENSTSELWSQFAFLNPGMLGSFDYFQTAFATQIERHQSDDTAHLLRRMVYPFILRRTKDQVAADLPPRTERLLVSDMEPAQRRLYSKQRDYYRAMLLGLLKDENIDSVRMKVLEGLLRLRQICNHPRLVDERFKGASGKFEALLETLETLRAEGHRALVFSQFVQMLTLVREALDARGIPYVYLDGQTRNREEVVDRFQNDDSVPFFLISLKAGGVGLNLTAADYVIHIDPWWNPAVEMQATDRTHRIGQDKPVFVYKFIMRDSVEEKILQLQDKKRALVEQVVGVEGGVFKSLTREDVEVLFT